MAQNFEIDAKLHKKLQSLACPFEEKTPVEVIRRLVEDALRRNETEFQLMNGIDPIFPPESSDASIPTKGICNTHDPIIYRDNTKGQWRLPSEKYPITSRYKYRNGLKAPKYGRCFPDGWRKIGDADTLQRRYVVSANPNQNTIHIDLMVPVASGPAGPKNYHLDTLVLWRGKNRYYDKAKKVALNIMERLVKGETPEKIISSL